MLSHPEKEERDPQKKPTTFPCDENLRDVIRALRAAGETSNSKLANETGLNPAVASQYLNEGGNIYPGDTAKVEARLSAWLQRRELEKLAGIPTIKTPVSEQIAAAARHAVKCRLMVKCIGLAGIGKTRGAILLGEADASSLIFFCSREKGGVEAIRAALFNKMGIRGPRKRTSNRKRLMYDELVKRLKDSAMLLVFDQAHTLSARAIDFLTELWNDTRSPQLWLSTEELHQKLERHEQWASRLDPTVPLSVIVDDQINEVRGLVEHQIKSRIPDLNGELAPLRKQCERLAVRGSFRRVEMRLATMLFLRESPRNAGRSWCDLFSDSEQFLTKFNGDN